MNRIHKIGLLGLMTMFLMITALNSVTTTTGQEMHEAMDHCDDPTVTRSIDAAPSDQDIDLTFDPEEITVPKNTCVKIEFTNMAPTQEHSFVIDETDNFEFVHIHSHNASMGVKSQNIMTPDEDTEFEFYCGVVGHKDAGMVGTLIVGDGNSGFLPGFELFSVLSVFLIGIPIIARKRRN